MDRLEAYAFYLKSVIRVNMAMQGANLDSFDLQALLGMTHAMDAKGTDFNVFLKRFKVPEETATPEELPPGPADSVSPSPKDDVKDYVPDDNLTPQEQDQNFAAIAMLQNMERAGFHVKVK